MARRRSPRDYVRTIRTMRAAVRLTSSKGRANPYPIVRRIQKIAPVVYLPPHNWVVSRYAEVASVLRDPRFSSDMETRNLRPGWEEKMREFRKEHESLAINRSMLFRDGADHDRLRGLVGKAFTPRMVEGLRARVQQIADELLDAVEPSGRMDVVADFAYPIPITVICELLGVPEDTRANLREWTAMAARALDPSLERTKIAVEEFLRYDPPVTATLRIAKEDVAIGGTTIPAGHDVFPIIAAANRDPRQFKDPDTLVIDRPDNKHLTFSGGPHFCLGAPLARLEGQIAFSTLLRRFPNLKLETEEPDWRD